MTHLTAVLSPGPEESRREVEQVRRRRGGAATAPGSTWSGGQFAVEVAGRDSALAVEPDLVVAVAGRVDELGHEAARSRAQDAAQRLVKAFRDRGTDAFEGACGDFVAVLHERQSGAVHVFRDLGGAVPVYVHGEGAAVLATVSMRELAASGRRLVPDERWVRSYLDGQWPSSGVSPYQHVSLVPPGHLASARSGLWQARAVDDWRWVQDVPADLHASAERFRELFDRAVAVRLRADGGGTAVSTSGGLDSSSVLVTGRAVAPQQRLTAVCLRFSDPRADEAAHQDAVVTAAGADLVEVAADQAPGPFGADPAAVIAEHGAPPLGGNSFLHAAMRRAVEARGVVRMLDGEDGDGVLGGQPLYLADLLGRGRLLRWAREVDQLGRARRVSRAGLARSSVVQARAAARNGERGRAYLPRVRGLVRDGYLSALGAETYAQWQDLDGAVAHPFLDRRLVEYALVVPAEQRIAGGLSKVLLRQAMGNRLPRSVADRRDKAVLSSAFDRAVRGPQRDLLHEGLERARPVLDQLGRRAPDVETDLGTSSGVFRLYRTAIIGHWTAGLDDYSALPWVHKPSPSLRKGPT